MDAKVAAEAEEELMEDSKDSEEDSTSDDSEFEVDVSLEDVTAITELERDLQANPNLYDVHLQYITILRKCKMRENVRKARQAMHMRFPLGETLWMEWIEDEVAENEKDAGFIAELYESAVKDYLSLRIWASYLQFLASNLNTENSNIESLHAFREVGERALTAGGIHLAGGAQLWNTYRGFEEQLLLGGADGETQVQRVRSLFHRQLQVPLYGNSEVHAAHKEWEGCQQNGQELPAHVEKAYQKAQEAVELRRAHEEAVAPGKEANADLMAAYMAYIKLEEAQGDPARVTVLYERAISVFPVAHYLWMRYACYVEIHIKMPGAIKSVYERAVRNCPWIGSLWARGLRALERGGASDEEHAAFHEYALQAGLQSPEDYLEVLLARIDCLRRKGQAGYAQTRAAFHSAQELLSVYFPDWVDRSLQLTAYRADCALRLGAGIAEARSVWNAALKSSAGRYVETWQGFIATETAEQHVPEARALYKRAYTRKLEENGQVTLCQSWVRFEREHGSAEDQLQAELKVEPIIDAASAAAAAAANEQATAAAQAQTAAEKAPKLSREEIKRRRQERDPTIKKATADAEAMPPPASRMPPKRRKGLGFQEPRVAKRQRGGDIDSSAAGPSGAAQQQGSGAANGDAPAEHMDISFASAGPQDVNTINETGSTMAAAASAPPQQPQRQANGGEGPAEGSPAATERQLFDDTCTAFVKNLPFKATAEELEHFFEDCGGAKEVRILRGPDGRTKGLAYVEFHDKAGLERAVAKNGAQFQGRPLSIEVSRPPGPGQRARVGGRGPGRGGGGRGGRGEGGPGRGDGAFRGRGWQGRGDRGGLGNRGGRGRGGGRGDYEVGKEPQHHAMHLDLSGAGTQQTGLGKGQLNKGGPPKSNADFRSMFLKK